MEEKKNSALLTVKNVMRLLVILVIIMFFCPSFLVSCQGQKVSIGATTAIAGVKAFGEKVSDGNPILLLLIILPIIMLVFLFWRKFTTKRTNIIILALAAVDFVIWCIFCGAVQSKAQELMCEFKVTAGFVFNIIFLLLIILITGLVLLGKIKFESEVTAYIPDNQAEMVKNVTSQIASHIPEEQRQKIKETASGIGKSVSEAAGDLTKNIVKAAGDISKNIKNTAKSEVDSIGKCEKCGSELIYGNKFCTSCGMPIPVELIEKAEILKKEQEEARILAEQQAVEEHEKDKQEKIKEISEPKKCASCGTDLEEDSVFCTVCGNKVE